MTYIILSFGNWGYLLLQICRKHLVPFLHHHYMILLFMMQQMFWIRYWCELQARHTQSASMKSCHVNHTDLSWWKWQRCSWEKTSLSTWNYDAHLCNGGTLTHTWCHGDWLLHISLITAYGLSHFWHLEMKYSGTSDHQRHVHCPFVHLGTTSWIFYLCHYGFLLL